MKRSSAIGIESLDMDAAETLLLNTPFLLATVCFGVALLIWGLVSRHRHHRRRLDAVPAARVITGNYSPLRPRVESPAVRPSEHRSVLRTVLGWTFLALCSLGIG